MHINMFFLFKSAILRSDQSVTFPFTRSGSFQIKSLAKYLSHTIYLIVLNVTDIPVYWEIHHNKSSHGHTNYHLMKSMTLPVSECKLWCLDIPTCGSVVYYEERKLCVLSQKATIEPPVTTEAVTSYILRTKGK